MPTKKILDLDSLEKAVLDYNNELEECCSFEKELGIVIENKITSWVEFKNYISKLPYTFYYRGQADARWILETRLDRYFAKKRRIFVIGNTVKQSDFEWHLMSEFYRNASMLNLPENLVNTYTQKLSYLQHHGAPTRLLDITSSPYVAAFFALIDCIPTAPIGESFCSVYIFDNEQIYIQNKSLILGISKLHYPDRKTELLQKFHNSGFNDEVLFELFFLKPYPTEQESVHDNLEFIGFISPTYYFTRLLQQSGAFLCKGNINLSFLENYKSRFQGVKKSPVKKLIISSKIRDDALLDLEKMNITYSTLFGDTEAQVKSIALKTELHFKKHHKWFVQKFY